jgi:molybdopterin synthase sulfur carrier subunit
MLKILYLARLREDLGKGEESLDLPGEVATVALLRAHLMARGGAWQRVLGDNRSLRAAVNQEMAQPETPIKPGDEVAFFPPVTGG